MRTSTDVLTNMIMIQHPETGKIVVQDRRKKEWGGITLPGGHVEPGESLVASAIREAEEETGLRVANLELRGVAHWCRTSGGPGEDGSGRHIVFLYRTRTFSGELIGETPEGPVFWAALDDLPGMKLSANLEPMIEAMVRDDKSEAFAEWVDDFSAPMVVL
jgi:8-oxo-dGTP diphosphatase